MLPSRNMDQWNIWSTSLIRLTQLHWKHPYARVFMRSVHHSPSTLQEYHNRVRRLANRLSSCATDQANASGLSFVESLPCNYFSYAI